MTAVSIDKKSLRALICEWLIIAILMIPAIRADTFWLYIVVGLIIATRQHALFILFHDAVHGHLARNRLTNDALINFFVGVPLLLPVEFYRPLHMLHHRTVGTAQDPERQLLYAGQNWNFTPLTGAALVQQLIGDLFLVNGIRTLRAWAGVEKPSAIQRTTIVSAIVWITGIFSLLAYSPNTGLRILLLWFAPLLTVTQLLQKLRSYAEHSGGPGMTPGWAWWTYSWQVGLAGALTVWPYNTNYHREHHDAPHLHWHELPGKTASQSHRLAGTRLWSLLYRRT